MKSIRVIILTLAILLTSIVTSGFTEEMTSYQEYEGPTIQASKQMINMFVSHGHCSLPFAGEVSALKVVIPHREDGGNPLENMTISFEINPNTFNVCRGEDLTKKIKTPGLFTDENFDKITFESTDLYTMGLGWYQINGNLSIKGVKREVKFFATGIRGSLEQETSKLVLESQLNLYDWGIDYDKIVNGESGNQQTKWMHLNMIIDLC